MFLASKHWYTLDFEDNGTKPVDAHKGLAEAVEYFGKGKETEIGAFTEKLEAVLNLTMSRKRKAEKPLNRDELNEELSKEGE